MAAGVAGTDEQAIARRILALEREVDAMLRELPAAAAVLAHPVRAGRTRAVAVDRLRDALDRAIASDPRRAAPIQARWSEAQAERWKLALSVRPLARREARRVGGGAGMPEEDLIQEALIGLFGAAKRFEPDRGLRFSTYARWWVRAQLTRAIDQHRPLRMSARATEQLRNLRREIRLREATGGPWTVREVAEDLGIPPAQADRLLVAGDARSVDESIGEAAFEIRDDLRDDPEQVTAQREQIARVHAALMKCLPDRHRRVVEQRYGIGREPRSLAEIARRMSLSGERVRQLERESLAVLRGAGLGA